MKINKFFLDAILNESNDSTGVSKDLFGIENTLKANHLKKVKVIREAIEELMEPSVKWTNKIYDKEAKLILNSTLEDLQKVIKSNTTTVEIANKILRICDDSRKPKTLEEQRLVTWINQLQNLEGIPLRYIIPLHHLLPNESIRFFTLDSQWIEHLIKGALSVGSHNKLDKLYDMEASPMLLKSSIASEETSIAHQFLNYVPINKELISHCIQAHKQVLLGDNSEPLVEKSGFIMRSEFVQRFPGVKIEAKDKDRKNCKVLRSETIDSDLKIMLFSGTVQEIIFSQNQGGMACEYKEKNDSNNNQFVNEKNVIDVEKLAGNHNVKNSAQFANALLRKPQKYTYILTIPKN